MKAYFESGFGKIIHGDSLAYMMEAIEPQTVDLIMTSPPFGLVRKKDYGNVDADDYIHWFEPFGAAFKRILKPTGSLVIDIGGSWVKGQPTRSLYHFKLLIMLCEKVGFHLAQEFYWWNPSKLPTPAEWVTVRRVRVKDAVNSIWWLSTTPYPKTTNKRVLQPYSDSMKELLTNGYKAKKRPSGHDISDKFLVDNQAAIPPNLLAIANTESNSYYLNYCTKNDIKPHPARFPADLPEFFIRMLTDKNDLIIDPFAGSCVTGEVSERLERRWICIDTEEEYLRGALGRFETEQPGPNSTSRKKSSISKQSYYRIPRPGLLWEDFLDEPLSLDGGRKRETSSENLYKVETDLPPSTSLSSPGDIYWQERLLESREVKYGEDTSTSEHPSQTDQSEEDQNS